MHYFIYSTSDTWIWSGSNRTTGETERDQNFGGDQILEVNFLNFKYLEETKYLKLRKFFIIMNLIIQQEL